MLTSTVALVLGAGASRDFGTSEQSPFPLGDDLRLQIAGRLSIQPDTFGQKITNGSWLIFSALKRLSHTAEPGTMNLGALTAVSREIASALPGCESIDDLLEQHSANPLYAIAGKLGIAECVAAAERNSPLRKDPTTIRLPAITKYSHHWLSRLLQGITKGCNVEALSGVFGHLKVINFNYDRCFEWFTLLWLCHVYALDEHEAWKILNSIEIIHPYGSLGPLPTGSNQGFLFGAEPDAEDLIEIHKNILTYSESVEEDGRALQITSVTREATKVIFLGFAFHQQNMKLLDFEKGVMNSREVYATTVGMPQPRWEAAQRRILNSLRQTRGTTVIISSPKSCCELITDYADAWTE